MSIVICDHCGRMIDSDDDPDCFLCDPWGKPTDDTLCEACRERSYDDSQRWLMETGGGPTLQEQQIEAKKYK